MSFYLTNKDRLCGRTILMEDREKTLQELINILFGNDIEDDFDYENYVERNNEKHDRDMNNYFDNFNER